MPAPDGRARVLILGGTAEGRALAALLVGGHGERLDVVSSLAGRTASPLPVAGRVRRGGFGGEAGLTRYLRRTKIDILVDATHPFAAAISRHATAAASIAGTALIRLVRLPWQPKPGDRWIEVADATAAAQALPGLGKRVWLTVGGRDLDAFCHVPDTWFLVRRVDRPAETLTLRRHKLILGRGPFDLAGERRLIARHRIEVLVTKASGGPGTAAKLEAARGAGLPVVMIRRPPDGAGPSVNDPPEAAAAVLRALGLTKPAVKTLNSRP
jgi:precorrin-6A/cobalt-precorrin-6A reductase